MNFDPKKAFNETVERRPFHEMVATDWFHAGAQACLAQMAMNLNAAPDMATAASYHYRMEGAKQFLRMMMTLTEPPTPAPGKPNDNLDHRTK